MCVCVNIVHHNTELHNTKTTFFTLVLMTRPQWTDKLDRDFSKGEKAWNSLNLTLVKDKLPDSAQCPRFPSEPTEDHFIQKLKSKMENSTQLKEESQV